MTGLWGRGRGVTVEVLTFGILSFLDIGGMDKVGMILEEQAD